jgi:hypothetical protein
MCVAQPLVRILDFSCVVILDANLSKYGKLSDIFGRKTMLQVSYFLFALGGAIW